MKAYRCEMMQEVAKVDEGRGPRTHLDFWTGDLCAEFQKKKGIWLDQREMAFILTTDGVQLFTLGQFTVSSPSPPPPRGYTDSNSLPRSGP